MLGHVVSKGLVIRYLGGWGCMLGHVVSKGLVIRYLRDGGVCQGMY